MTCLRVVWHGRRVWGRRWKLTAQKRTRKELPCHIWKRDNDEYPRVVKSIVLGLTVSELIGFDLVKEPTVDPWKHRKFLVVEGVFCIARLVSVSETVSGFE